MEPTEEDKLFESSASSSAIVVDDPSRELLELVHRSESLASVGEGDGINLPSLDATKDFIWDDSCRAFSVSEEALVVSCRAEIVVLWLCRLFVVGWSMLINWKGVWVSRIQ